MDLTPTQVQMLREREHADQVYAEYRRLRHLMFTAPTEAQRQAALQALRALGSVRELV